MRIGGSLLALDLILALIPDSVFKSKPMEIRASHSAPVEFEIPTQLRTPATVSPAASPTPPPKSVPEPVVLSSDQADLCVIHKNSSIPLNGEIKVQSVERLEGGRNYWIRSSNCPDELYSIVSLDSEGRIDQEINCERTNITELSLKSGLQFNIDVAAPDEKHRPMAISGPGRFLVNCPDGGLTLTRDGYFNQESDSLVNSEGCVAWRLEGARRRGGEAVKFQKGEELDSKGCSLTSRECLDILEPDPDDLDAFNFKTKKSLSVMNERGLRRSSNSTLFHQALEDLDSVERSLTGIQAWETLKPTQVPTVCP